MILLQLPPPPTSWNCSCPPSHNLELQLPTPSHSLELQLPLPPTSWNCSYNTQLMNCSHFVFQVYNQASRGLIEICLQSKLFSIRFKHWPSRLLMLLAMLTVEDSKWASEDVSQQQQVFGRPGFEGRCHRTAKCPISYQLVDVFEGRCL